MDHYRPNRSLHRLAVLRRLQTLIPRIFIGYSQRCNLPLRYWHHPKISLRAGGVMNSAVTIRAVVSIRQADSIADEIEAAYDEITRRAYELFLSRPNGSATDIEDWLEAERQVLIKP